jgi:VanZ family protein
VKSPVALWLRVLAWLAFAGWVGTIYYLSSLSGPEIAQFHIEIWDKLEHFSAFFVGGCLLVLALRWSVVWSPKKVAWFAFLCMAAYGALDEIHQLFTPFRSGADPFDWMADCTGGLAGVLLFTVIYARYFRAPRTAPVGA